MKLAAAAARPTDLGKGRRPPIAVVPYRDAWATAFESLRARVQGALGPLAVRVEHVGSTSVPGLRAKPIIDMDVVIESEGRLEEVASRLATVGYKPRGDLGVTGRYTFSPPAGLPDHHLYVCARDNVELHRHLALRDYLRRHPGQAAAYGRLKQTLAKAHPFDREAYTEGKTCWIERALKLAREDKATCPPTTGR